MSATRSIHFPPSAIATMGADIRSARAAEKVNILECFSSALQNSETIRELLRGLVVSSGRHGDLQAALSAARELEARLLALIEAEES
jgi:hypothetical protein